MFKKSEVQENSAEYTYDMISRLQLNFLVFQASALDPLLDDSVEFVRKLHALNKPAELYILEKLPHGFLNFQPFSAEAREGCDLLIACIKKSLNMGMRRMDSTQSFGLQSMLNKEDNLPTK